MGGKTFNGLMRHLRWVNDPLYRGYVIRKHQTTLAKSGGVIDESKGLYKDVFPDAVYKTKEMRWIFPSGAQVAFSHLDTEEDAEKYRGLQISAAMLDEATQFSEEHVLVILSRLRTQADMKPSLWLTCNPNPMSFIRRWIDWWIIPQGEENAGRPNPERDGKIRWFIRDASEMIWADSKEELLERYGNRDMDGDLIPEESEHQHCRPLSLQFISATIYDNPPLLRSNPGYLANLQGLKRVKRERDLYGNWDVREEVSGYFQKEWVNAVKYHEQEFVSYVRAWDLAGTKKSEINSNPDWTAGVLMGRTKQGRYVIIDVERFRDNYGGVMQRILECAKKDPYGTKIILPKEPGQAGKIAAAAQLKTLQKEGFTPSFMGTGSKSKVVRFQPFTTAAEMGLIDYIEGEWNDSFFDELENFTGERKNKDDQVDAVSDAYASLSQKRSLPNMVTSLVSGAIGRTSTLPF